MRKKVLPALLLAAAVVAAATLLASPAPVPEPYVDPWETVQAMSEEEVIAIGKKVLVSKNGELPDYALTVTVRLQEIDPELAEACFQHINEIATPAKKPAEKKGLFHSSGPDRFGAYVRDGNGGYYEYYDE